MASVNSVLKSGLIFFLKQEFNLICLVWCVSHGIDVALKDSLGDYLESIDTILHSMYYMYQNSINPNLGEGEGLKPCRFLF